MPHIYPFLIKSLDINETSVQEIENEGIKYDYINAEKIELKETAAVTIFVIANSMKKGF